MKIKHDVLESLFDGNIRVENVFIMQLISSCDSMPDSFWGVFDDNHEEVLKAIGLGNANTSDYDDLSTKSELLDFLHDKKVYGVLIQFATPIPRNFSFDDDGEFSSCSCSWGMTSWHFAHGKSIDAAIDNAISIQGKYWDECLKSAKL